jgi:type IV pilus assembly protein PilW
MRDAMNNIRMQRGFSLIELMISITLALIILAAIALVFFNASQSRSELERVSRQIENGRYAIDLLVSDLRVAGFYGELDLKPIAGTALPDPCSLAVADWKTGIPVHVQGKDNDGYATCPLTNQKAGTDVLVVRRVRTCIAGAAGCDAAENHRPYLQVSLCATDPGPDKYALALNEDAAAFTYRKKDCTAAADKRQYYVHIYYIATDNGAGDSIPTLKRLELDVYGGAPAWSNKSPAEAVPLVEGIEELNLEYGLDVDNDGAPDVYTADPNDYALPPATSCTGSCPLNNWMNVVAVQIHLLARNLEASPEYTDNKTYSLGLKKDGTPFQVTPGGNYRRHAYSGLVRIANVSNRRDVP